MENASAPRVTLSRQLGTGTATSIVVANMIGAGIFTTTGLIYEQLGDPQLVLLAWFLGGLIALAGAVSYAELAAMLPRAGGEYNFLREIYGPLPAFLTGWTSFFVGFSAPIAASAAGAGLYLAASVFPAESAEARELFGKAVAAGVVLLFSALHTLGLRQGARIQNALTLFKVLLLAGMVLAGLIAGEQTNVGELTRGGAPGGAFLERFGVSLLWVMFAYSGWNAAAYIAEELRQPERTLPRSLLAGTLVVMALYLAVNAQILAAPDPAALSGAVNVFDVAIAQIFGKTAGRAAAALVFLALLSSLSAYVLIGPRVYFAMARDGLFFRGAAEVHPRTQTPLRAIWAQAACSLVMVASSTFDQLLTYIGFALGLFPMLAVAGVIVLRKRQPERFRPYRTWGYPLTPLFFLLGMAGILAVSFMGRPKESLIALATVAAGIPIYWLWTRYTAARSPAGNSGRTAQ